ncbi:MAG TPA: cell surface protein SprA [Flavobacteriales bacterium]|jgi:cell surface protein SprA|nr:cell surface protein SprA [Flavobacteriales bacterium]
MKERQLFRSAVGAGAKRSWGLVLLVLALCATNTMASRSLILQVDSPEVDLVWPITDPLTPGDQGSGRLNLGDPENIQNDVIYDPVTGQYIMQSSVGGSFDFRPPMSLSLEEYLQYDMERSMENYWLDRVEQDSESAQKDLIPKIKVRGEAFDRIFGGNTIDIKPRGSAEVIFGVNISKTENPRIPIDQRRITTFNFDQRIQLNLVGNIGEKLKINTNYNTQATFDFENQVKLDYTGYEDEIIQKIEAGNVSLPLRGTLIQGSQSLFGLKTELRFGRLTATAIFSQEKGQRRNVQTQGGAQTTNFDIKADEYEANKHYFLSHFFRGQYENAMRTLPTVNSGVQITRVEVWVTNVRQDFQQNRNVVAFTDLGEDASAAAIAANQLSGDLPPGLVLDGTVNVASNAANTLYQRVSNDPGIRGFFQATGALQVLGLRDARHFERLENARLLLQNEYTINDRLGFISLNQSLNNDEVLAVAYQYTFQGETYQVGEFSTDGIGPPSALVLRLLKATITDPKLPLWDLMMKNIYSLGAFQVNRDNFRLDLIYNNPTTGVDINYIPRAPLDQIPLIQALGLDRLDPNNAPNPDGWFDFIDGAATVGGTIQSQSGRIFFPVLEPFGEFLDRQLVGPDPNAPLNPPQLRRTITYQQLYDSTKTAAQNQPEFNRFRLKGSYRSASSDVISLNSVNIPQGSVVVTAGGVRLIENQDYTVDYNLGRVRILNQGILESGTPVDIALESNSLFSIQTKTLAGARFDYKISKDLVFGGTIMNLYERPLTQKVNVGDEPISNTIVGIDGSWQTGSRWLTDLVDKLPFYATKAESNISASAEAAYLIPGHSKAIGDAGTSYIDDFEGSVSTIDLRTQSLWFHAATPQGQPDLFPEGDLVNDLRNGFRRAQLAWYVIDPLFFRNNNLTPQNIADSDEIRSDNRMREVLEQEVFPNRQLPAGTPANIPALDLTYYPSERGPYNYNTDLTNDGGLFDPEANWAGITRRITTTDFEASNIETVQFWMMDPFFNASNSNGEPATNEDSPNSTGGELYIDLGNISEDVLRDGRKFFENGLPKDLSDVAQATDTTAWGVIPTTQSVVNAFAIVEDNSNRYQDVGMDGLASTQTDLEGRNEVDYFRDVFLDQLTPSARARWQNDPSNDDYRFFRGTDFDDTGADILERYKYFNAPEGNSVTDEDSPEDYPTQQTTIPTAEDINQDQNLSESESYFHYRVRLRPQDMVVGRNYIADRILATANTPEGPKQVYWYQFKVPVRQPDAVVNGIQDFRSIRFMRMYVKGWQQEVTLRFARLEFVRGEWRKYNFSLNTPGEGPVIDPSATVFEVAAVNIEENGNRTPINYVLPPDINQEIDVASANLRNLNEQSLQMKTCNLRDGDARASFRNVSFDIRSYKKLRMYVHAESSDPNRPLNYGDVSVFMRLGNDYDQNYYEYEIPVVPSDFFDRDPYNVWPEANNMIIEFAKLNDIKIQRDQAGFPKNFRYEGADGDRRVFVKGNPNLSQMRTVMIGIRNPKKDGEEANPWRADDGQPQCVEVWVNELRLTDFDQRGGWAALARVNAQLADLGSVSVAGNYSTPFWGSIDKRVSERQRDTRYGVDLSANLELGKFLPEASNVRVPMYVGYSEQVINPQFDPLNPDIEFNEATRTLTRDERKERLKQTRTYTRRRSINFTNVRKDRGEGAKEQFFDVENLTLSYAYSEQEYFDVNTAFENTRTYRGALGYQFNPKPLAIEPFKNIGIVSKSKWLKLIKDFNVNMGFKQVTLRTSVDRMYLERLVRPNPDIESLPPRPTYNKNFNWSSQYGFRYELTRSLKLDFNANNLAVIGETPGRVNPKIKDEYELWKDSVLTSIRDFGEVTRYDHTIGVNYTLPLDKFPLTDWITANTTYTAGYQWDRAPFTQDTLGNTIQNSQNIAINGQLNFVNLYNKSKWLKKINDKGKGKAASKGGKAATPTKTDSTKTAKPTGEKFNVLEGLARVMMTLRNGTITYSQTSGTLLPGYARSTNILGMDGFQAPGFGFITGQQNHDLSGDLVRDFATTAAENDWLVRTPSIFNPYTNTRTETFNGRVSLEPFKGMRVEVTANRTLAENRSSFFRWDESTSSYVNDSPRDYGNFSVSMLTWPTAFARDDENFVNEVFERVLEYRPLISARLAGANPNAILDTQTGFYTGYGPTNQDVVIPSFLAAYTGKAPDKVKLDPFKQLPMPNWDITYDGLTKVPLFAKYFRTFTLKNSYRSSFSIANYQTNLLYEEGANVVDAAGNFIPQRQISVITIQEVMRPFASFDATLKNSMLLKFEYNRDRNLSLSLTNYQVTEIRGKEYVVGTGYRFKNVKFPFAIGGVAPKSDLNLRVDLSLRDNATVIRKMEERQNQVTAGQNILSIKTSADYVINQRLNIRAFYERVVNTPVISTSFPSANTNAGISLRFTLAQ